MSARFGDVIDVEWHQSGGAEDYFKSLLHRGQRRKFGLLERPSLAPSKEAIVAEYKIFLCGCSGVGKTSTIAKLAGSEVPKYFCETAGIETTAVYWPARIKSTGKVMFFRLNFWDVGDNVIRKFEHILPACQANADCYIYVFSFTDRASFDDIPQLVSRMMGDDSNPQKVSPAQLIVGTKADQYTHSDISEAEVTDLSQSWEIPVLRMKNINSNEPAMTQLAEVSPVLNTVCAALWARDHSINQ